jgi:hypothetical protein
MRSLIAGVIALALAVVGPAASAEGEGNIMFPSITSGPPGTVVTLTGPVVCDSQPRMLLYANVTGSAPADRSQGVPVDLTSGTITIPQVSAGEYQVLFLCGTAFVAYFFFTVEPGAVVAQPNLAV